MNPNENMQFRDNRDFWFSHLDIQVMQYKGLSFYAKAIYALLTTYVDIRTRSWNGLRLYAHRPQRAVLQRNQRAGGAG